MARQSVVITPNDGADLARPITALYVGGAGDIKIELVKDAAGGTVLKSVPAGTLLDGLVIKKIHATGTSATFLVGFF